VVEWRWHDVIRCDHPVFNVHRIGLESGEPELAAILDDPRIASGLTRDLSSLVPSQDFECIVSVHPWSSVIVANATQCLASKSRPFVVDCHGEFTPFPLRLVTVPGVDAYLGGLFPGPASPRVRRRMLSTGIPVRTQFQRAPLPPQSGTRRALAISLGHGSWAQRCVDACIAPIIEFLQPQALYVIGTRVAADAWDARVTTSLKGARYVASADEIASALRRSSHLVTKASGSAVAEALACDCTPLCVATGVFWEDESRAWLASSDAAIPIDAETALSPTWWNRTPQRSAEFGARSRKAAAESWRFLERRSRRLDSPSALSAARLVGLVASGGRVDDQLPATTRNLADALSEWQ
jgi:hypothetical protein